jgi:hypothetical protein
MTSHFVYVFKKDVNTIPIAEVLPINEPGKLEFNLLKTSLSKP